MRFFTCLLGRNGCGISDAVRRAYESMPRSRGLDFQWLSVGHVLVLNAGDDRLDNEVAVKDGDHVAVGLVRLDNREDLERWTNSPRGIATDLELVLRAVARHGTRYIPRFLGDFAFVVSNRVTRAAVGACDAFAVKKLYYTERESVIAFASRAEALAQQDGYNVQYLAELVGMCVPSPGLSVYAGVNAVPGGNIVEVADGRLTMRQYWSAYDFQPEPALALSERNAAEQCRSLLVDSVRVRLGNESETWAQLSGGIDSSSVVSVAQWLATSGALPHGLSGTVSYVDSHGTGADEREYSDAVVKRWALRNDTIIDAPIWHDPRFAFPRTDEPRVDLVFYPRDARLCQIVRNAGGRVLLTGAAGDILFTGNMFFFADWITRGRVWPAMREMARRASMGRVSFWDLAYRNALLPLLPRTLQHRFVQDEGQTPQWVRKVAARRYGVHIKALVPLTYAGRCGHKYQHGVAARMAAIPGSLAPGVIEDTLDVRHPYLYRPLVEFALRLPPALNVRPNERKWVLREAMRDILPDVVRLRVGKGANYGRFAWSLSTQRAILEPLLLNPVLADLEIIDAEKLRAAVHGASYQPDGRQRIHGAVHHTLAIEAWIQMRSGRWHTGALVSSEAANEFSTPSA
jgi:asparagine synthase (glutamine-hydrolysing)